MTKHYTHEEIRAIIDLAAESPLKLDLPDYKAELYKEAPAIIRQLLDEINQELKESHKEACKYESKISDLTEQIDEYLQSIDELRRLIEDLDDKRETAVRMLRQSEKRIAELEALEKKNGQQKIQIRQLELRIDNLKRDNAAKNKRIDELETLLAEHKSLDPLAKVPPFDWGPEGESGGEPIKYAAISKDGKKMFVTQGDQIAEIDLDAATKNDPGARAYFGLDDGSESNG